MTQIVQSATLVVCHFCGGLHAQIVFSDGMLSPNFGTKKRGFGYLEAAKASGLTIEGEDRFVIDQIMLSPLPFTDEERDKLIASIDHPGWTAKGEPFGESFDDLWGLDDDFGGIAEDLLDGAYGVDPFYDLAVVLGSMGLGNEVIFRQ